MGCVLAIACTMGCAPAAHAQPNIEQRMLENLTRNRTNDQTRLFKAASGSVTCVGVGLPASLLLVGLATHDADMKNKAIYMGESAVVTGVVTLSLKYTIRRPRPAEKDPLIIPIDEAGSPSFPSGHTALAFSTATSISIAYPRWYVIVPAFVWASTVGYSRMYLGVHYPSDVIAGAVLGSASAWLSWKANQWLARKKPALILFHD